MKTLSPKLDNPPKLDVPAPRRLLMHLRKKRALSLTSPGSTTCSQDLIKHCEYLEQKLQCQSQELSRTQSALAREKAEFQAFTDSVSHDLQAPLRATRGFSACLLDEYQEELDETAKDYLNRIDNAGKKLQARLKGILSLSRIQTRGSTFTLVDLNVVYQNVLISLREAIQEQSATITACKLPTVFGDADQLEILLKNLIENSLKFRRDNNLTINLNVKTKGDRWTISVSDNGIGIEEKYKEDVFSMFRCLNVRSQHSGVGAGLAICRRIMERHSGQIYLKTSTGQGCTFEFCLPRNSAS